MAVVLHPLTLCTVMASLPGRTHQSPAQTSEQQRPSPMSLRWPLAELPSQQNIASSNCCTAPRLIGSVTAAQKKLFGVVSSEQCNPQFYKGGVEFKNVIETVEQRLGWEYGEQRRPFFGRLGSQIKRFCSRTDLVRVELVFG